MARKFNSRGGFRGLQVRRDDYTGRDLREILTAATLNCYASLEKVRTEPNTEKVAERIAYHNGLIQYIKGLEVMMDAQGSKHTRTLAQDPLARERSVEERRQYIERARNARRLMDKLLDSALEQSRSLSRATPEF